MGTALLVARLLLALIFVVAGLAKLADRAGSRQAVSDFGLPVALAAPLGVLLPLAELAVAAALVPAATAWWGALGALALLLAFVAAISVSLARGRRPDCHCFGQLHSAPAGWGTLARNGALAAVAGFVVWAGHKDAGPGVAGWLGDLSAAQLAGIVAGLVLLALVVAQWWFLVHLLRQNGRLLVRLEGLEAALAPGAVASVSSSNGGQRVAGLPVGASAPTFSLPGLRGETLTLQSLRTAGEKPVMLLFTDPNCGPCAAMLPEIGRWQNEHSEWLTIPLVSRGRPEENRVETTEHGVTNVLLQEDGEVARAYGAPGTPSAVLVRPDGTIGSPVAAGAEAIRALLAYAVAKRTRPPMPLPTAHAGPCPNCGKAQPAAGHPEAQAAQRGPKVGEPVPELKLPDLSGNIVALAGLEGSGTLVLFWNPACGFCQRMLPDLKDWETNPPAGAPGLLVVSAGTMEANRAMGLRSTVVLDQNFELGRALGASGTPSAILIDAGGKIASGVAVGAPAVLELAGASRAQA